VPHIHPNTPRCLARVSPSLGYAPHPGGLSFEFSRHQPPPFVIYFVAVLLLVATMLGLSYLLGQRRANNATNLPFESGVLSVGSSQIQMSVEFYLGRNFLRNLRSGNGIHLCLGDCIF